MNNFSTVLLPLLTGWQFSDRVKEGLAKFENMIDIGISLFMLMAGIMYLLQAIKLVRTKELFNSSILYPNNLGPDNCKKPQEFIKFIVPRLFLVSALFCGFGILTIVLFLFGNMNTATYDIILMSPPLLILVYYMSCLHRAAFAFWK